MPRDPRLKNVDCSPKAKLEIQRLAARRAQSVHHVATLALLIGVQVLKNQPAEVTLADLKPVEQFPGR